MKKIILFLATVILMTSCSGDSKFFFGRQIDWVYQNEGNYCLGFGGSNYSPTFEFGVISISYPGVPVEESHFQYLYDAQSLFGNYEYVGTHSNNTTRGAYFTVPVYMSKKNFYYLYRKDRKYLINTLNKAKIKHTIR